jgi:hypothetical protein
LSDLHEEDPAASRARRPWRVLAHAAVFLLGILAVTALVRHAGSRELAAVLGRASRILPLALFLEGARIVAEMAATRALLGERARQVPRPALVHAHLVGYAVTVMMPAGRAVAEAVKATLLARHVGWGRAAAVGTANQAMSLLASAVISVPCTIAAFGVAGASALPLAIAAHTVAVALAGFAIQLGTRHAGLFALLERRMPRAAAAAEAYARAAKEHGVVPTGALVAFIVDRALQVVQCGLLAYAVGAAPGPLTALVGQGVQFVGTTIGDLVPAQIGATDGAFALAASTLGISIAAAVALALLLHCVQLAWVVLGAAAAILGRPRSRGAAAPGGMY